MRNNTLKAQARVLCTLSSTLFTPLCVVWAWACVELTRLESADVCTAIHANDASSTDATLKRRRVSCDYASNASAADATMKGCDECVVRTVIHYIQSGNAIHATVHMCICVVCNVFTQLAQRYTAVLFTLTMQVQRTQR